MLLYQQSIHTPPLPFIEWYAYINKSTNPLVSTMLFYTVTYWYTVQDD